LNKVAAVVLNYKNYNDTIECVDSLLFQKGVNLEIIIVDNNSENESVEVLQKKYENNKRITLFTNDKNLGFNGGNNIGIRYAHDIKGCKFVLVINNDTIFPNRCIIKQMVEIYSPDIAVISADVIGTDACWQAPAFYLQNKLMRQTLFTCFSVILNYLFSFQLKWLIMQKRKFISGKKEFHKKVIEKQSRMDSINAYIIQGSAFMLTPCFFIFYKQLYPRTYLYWEEICLSWYLHKAKLKTILANNHPIVHKDNRSFSYGLNTEQVQPLKRKLMVSGLFKALPLFFMSYKMIDRTYNN